MKIYWLPTKRLVKQLKTNEPSVQIKSLHELLKRRKFELIKPILFELLDSPNFKIRKVALDALLESNEGEIENLAKALESLRSKIIAIEGKQKSDEDYVLQFIPLALVWHNDGLDYSIDFKPEIRVWGERELKFYVARRSDYSAYSSDTTWETHTTLAVYEDGVEICLEQRGGPGLDLELSPRIEAPLRTKNDWIVTPEKIELIKKTK